MDNPATSSGALQDRQYSFRSMSRCNMCGAPSNDARVLGLRLDKSQGLTPRDKKGIAVTVCRCRACGLVYADPMPIPRTISDHYGVPPESYWRSASFEVDEDYFSRQINGAIQIIGEDKTIKVIDVGLGLGKAARAMIAAGFDVYGLEPSEPFYRKALEQLNSQCTDRFQLASMEEAKFPVGEFDFVTFGAVLEHIYDPSASIAKAMRWLKAGGIVHIEVPNSNHLMSKFINAYYRMLGTGYVTNISPMHKPYHLYEFTLASFQKNGQVGGYEVIHHWFDVASIYHVPRVLHPPLRLWMKFSNSGMQLTVFLRKTS